MTILPLIEILFFLALLVAPKDAREIQVSGPILSAHWTMTAKGWQGGLTQAAQEDIWSIKDKTVVNVVGGRLAGKQDVAEHVEQAIGNDWARRPSVALAGQSTFDKNAAGFVYSPNGPGVGAQHPRYQISYRNSGSP